MIPQLTNDPQDLLLKWSSLKDWPGEVIVGFVLTVGLFVWRHGKVVKLEVLRGKSGNITTYRAITEDEASAVRHAVITNTLQVETRIVYGALGFSNRDDAGRTVRVLHQATGTWKTDF